MVSVSQNLYKLSKLNTDITPTFASQLEEQGLIPELTEEIGELQKEIDTALDEAIEKKARRYGCKSSSKDSTKNSEGDPVTPVADPVTPVADCEGELNEQGQEFLAKETLKYALDEDSQSEKLVEGILKVQSKESSGCTTLSDVSSNQTTTSQIGPRPTAASLGLKDSIEECMKPVEEKGNILKEFSFFNA